MVLALAGTVALTNSQKNQIRILVDTGELERALGLINVITAGGYTPELNAMRFRGPRAAGGPVAPGGSYLVGERGPELFTPSSSGNITPNGAIGGNTITVNVNGGDPQSVVNALRTYMRQNGSVPIRVSNIF
jgi:phage-related minor tail protein